MRFEELAGLTYGASRNDRLTSCAGFVPCCDGVCRNCALVGLGLGKRGKWLIDKVLSTRVCGP